MRHEGRVALVTGAASGIGRVTAFRLAREGATLALFDQDTHVSLVAAEIVAAGASARAWTVDIADAAAVETSVLAATSALGAVSILVNGAGWGEMQMFIENAPDYIDKLVAVNLTGPIHLTHALLPPMIAARKGKIVSIASDAGRVGSTGETVYAAAKGGIMAFTKSLAREMARHSINVNCVCPGPTDTPMLATRPEKIREAFIKATAFRRLGKPEEIADAVLFFASSRSDYITGQLLSVSGGLTFAG